MSQIEFMKFYHEVGSKFAQSMAEMYSVPLAQIELWLSQLTKGVKHG